MPAEIERVVTAGKATLHELRTVYTLVDLLDLLELIDVEADRQIDAMDEKHRAEAGYIWIGD